MSSSIYEGIFIGCAGARAERCEHDCHHCGGEEVRARLQQPQSLSTARQRLRAAALALWAAASCDLPPDAATPLQMTVRGIRISPNANMVTAAVASIDCSGSATAWQVAYSAPG